MKGLKKAEKKKRRDSGISIPKNSDFMEKVIQATKNIEGSIFERIRELGKRARMAKLLTILVEKLEANDFTFSRSKSEKIIYLGIDLEEAYRNLRLDPENGYIFHNNLEHILKNSIEISCKDKLDSINEYLEEQMQEEVLPGITLGMLIDEELLKDV